MINSAVAMFIPVSLQYMQAWQAIGLLLLLAVPIVLLGARTWSGMGPVRRWVSISLRLIVLALLVLALAGARWERRATDVEVIVVQDVSRSATNVQTDSDPDSSHVIQRYLQAASEAGRLDGDRVGLIRFDADAWVESLPNTALRSGGGGAHAALDGTNVAGAIQLGLATLGPDAMHRLVLLWDGNSSAGDLDAAIAAAVAQKVPIDVVPYRYSIQHEVAVEEVIAPGWAKKSDPFTVEVRLRSTNPMNVTGRLHLLENGAPVQIGDGAAARQVTLRPGLHVERITLPASDREGARRFQAYFESDEGAATAAAAVADTLTGNNSAEGITFVRGTGSVLYVDNVQGGQGHLLSDALARQGIRMEVTTPVDFPHSTMDLQGYEAVILANVPRGAGGFDEQQQEILASWVRNMGGGLVMVGGPDSFGAGGWIGSKLEEVLPVDCDVPGEVIVPASALMVVLDHSGSMSGPVAGTAQNKQQVANEAAILALRTLSVRDYVGAVAFDDGATMVADLQLNTNPTAVANAIRQLGPAGGTNIYSGLEMATDAMLRLGKQRAAMRHIILLSDGQSAGANYPQLLQHLKDQGITLSTVGVGDGVDDALLSYLATEGNGRYYKVTDARILPQIFTREARTLKRPLIDEEPFLPRIANTASQIMTGIDVVPPLGGMVLSTPKQDMRVTVPIWSPKGMPVLAHWQTGLGQSAAFTSDAQGRWAAEWVSSPLYGKFWSQVVRTVSRSMSNSDFDLRTEVSENGRGRIVVSAVGEAADAAQWQQMMAAVAAPDGQTTQQVRLQQTGPGRWTGEFEASDPGAYTAVVRHTGADGGGYLVSGMVINASAELRDLSSNEAAVRQIAERTGGRVLEPFEAASANWYTREGLVRMSVPLSVWDRLLLAAMIVFMLDIATRRIAIGPRELQAGAQRIANWIRSFTQPGSVAHRPAAAGEGMAALRKIKQPRAPQPDFAPAPKGGAIDALQGLGAAGGAAPPTPSSQTTAASTRKTPDAAPDDGMGSLLAAKRRAQRKMSGEE